jgi:hypothetical protein
MSFSMPDKQFRRFLAKAHRGGKATSRTVVLFKYTYAPRQLISGQSTEGLKGITIGDFWSWAYSDG